MTLRPYQSRALAEVQALYDQGARRVLLISPTGSGKSVMGAAIAKHYGRVLWLAHRLELLEQAKGKLHAAGVDDFQVASIDLLLARGLRPEADLVVLDEAHHAAADTYAGLLADYKDSLHLGLTATPQRSDGRAMGAHYDHMVVAASYPELLKAGAICRAKVRRAPEYLGSDLARHPLAEWQEYGEDRLTFAFAPSVDLAERYASEFNAAGIPSASIDGDTPAVERGELLERFRAGALRVLWNVFVLTEGVDVPEASCVLLARGVGAAGPFIQMVGRGLRTYPGKTDCLVLDMPGATWLHGLPAADRAYSLDGRPIRVVGEALKNCPQCGACVPTAENPCECCGYLWVPEKRRLPKIWNRELQWVTDADQLAGLSPDVKRREWQRLLGVVEGKDSLSVGFAKKAYQDLFQEKPPPEWLVDIPATVRSREWARMQAQAKARGWKPGAAAIRFKATVGVWPTSGRR